MRLRIPTDILNVVWFLERNGGRLLYEIRRSADADGYELVRTYPDGTVKIDKVTSSTELLRRSSELHDELVREGWRPHPEAPWPGP